MEHFYNLLSRARREIFAGAKELSPEFLQEFAEYFEDCPKERSALLFNRFKRDLNIWLCDRGIYSAPDHFETLRQAWGSGCYVSALCRELIRQFTTAKPLAVTATTADQRLHPRSAPVRADTTKFSPIPMHINTGDLHPSELTAKQWAYIRRSPFEIYSRKPPKIKTQLKIAKLL